MKFDTIEQKVETICSASSLVLLEMRNKGRREGGSRSTTIHLTVWGLTNQAAPAPTGTLQTPFTFGLCSLRKM